MIQPKSSIRPEILQQVLDSASNAADKGQSAFYTPIGFARHLGGALPEYRPVITDLTCGAGHILHGLKNKTTKRLLGADIDPCTGARVREVASFKVQVSSGAGAPSQLETSNLKLETPSARPAFIEHSSTEISRITRDLTLLAPKLDEVHCKLDLLGLNPPFRLFWKRARLQYLAESALYSVCGAFAAHEDRDRGGCPEDGIDSTIATLLIALDALSCGGEGFLIANHATLERLLFAEGAPHSAVAEHVWARVIVPGNPMTGDRKANFASKPGNEDYNTEVIYFAREHRVGPRTTIKWEQEWVEAGVNGEQSSVNSGEPSTDNPQPSTLNPQPTTGNSQPSTLNPQRYPLPDRHRHRFGSIVRQGFEDPGTLEAWSAVREECRTEDGMAVAHPYNLWLDAGGEVRTHLSGFQQTSKRLDKAKAARLNELNGRNPMQLVLSRATRDSLLRSAQSDGWRVDPALLTAIHDAIREYHAARAPLYPLNEIQRLGYLDEQDYIECKEDLHQVSSFKEQVSSDAPHPALSPSDGERVAGGRVRGAPLETSNLKLETFRPVFQAGQKYAIATRTVKVTRKVQKPNATTGEREDLEYTGMELAIYLDPANGEMPYAFLDANLRPDDPQKRKHITVEDQRHRVTSDNFTWMDIRNAAKSDVARMRDLDKARTHPVDFTLQDLVRHFHIPEVPDVATINPEGYANNIAALTRLEQVTEELSREKAVSLQLSAVS